MCKAAGIVEATFWRGRSVVSGKQVWNDDIVSQQIERERSNYESKFILDSFIFWVFPARILRRLTAIVNIFPRSRVSSCVLFGFNQVRFFKRLLLLLTFSHGSVISQQIS